MTAEFETSRTENAKNIKIFRKWLLVLQWKHLSVLYKYAYAKTINIFHTV